MVFKRYENNPIITPDPKNSYEKECTYNPCAIVHDNKVFMIYRAEDIYGKYVSTLCLATSEDGYNFKKYENNPIITPSLPEESRGCEDPRITKIGDIFYLTYVAYDGKDINIVLATSKDLYNWEKQGIIIKNHKSAAIYPEKINDEYFLLFGDSNIWMAKSKDLKNWEVDHEPILTTRENQFDSKLIEPGPAPIIINDKLVFIFNTADEDLIYRNSLAVLDKDNPRKILYRSDKSLLEPKEQFELYGKVNNVVFVSGLVKFKDKYFLYYGGADKCVGVASANEKELEDFILNLQ